MNAMNEKIKFFSENKVYTYIRLNSKTFFNGYIISFNDKSLILTDDVLGNKPILISDIEILDYSKKGVDKNGKKRNTSM